jgi:hypothetical protein
MEFVRQTLIFAAPSSSLPWTLPQLPLQPPLLFPATSAHLLQFLQPPPASLPPLLPPLLFLPRVEWRFDARRLVFLKTN